MCKRIKLLLLILLYVGAATAAPHVLRNIGTNEGLEDLLVNAFYEDADGLIWFGTGSSLELFDGIDLTHYPLPGEASQSQRVEAITGSSDAIYLINNLTLYCLDRKANSLKPMLEGEMEGVLRDIYVLDDHLYIATSLGLYVYDINGETLQRVLLNSQKEDAPQNELRHLRADREGNLWITSKAGLHTLSGTGEWSHYYYSDLPEDGFTEVAVSDSIIYLGSFHEGIYRFDRTTAQFSQVHKTISPVTSLQVSGDTLMTATDGDGVFLYRFSTKRAEQLSTDSKPYALTSNSIYRAMIDSRGIVWAGSYQHGLDYTLGQTAQFGIHHTDMLSTEGMAVRSLAIHDQQRLIGTRQGLYWVDKLQHKMLYYGEQQLKAKMIFATLYHEGHYYIGTFGGGLYTLEEDGTGLHAMSSPYIGNEIFSITTDSAGRVWVGSNTGVAALSEGRVVRHFRSDDSMLPPGLVYCIYFDHCGRGWICSAGGVVLYDAAGDSLTRAPLPEDFPVQMMVRSIYHDSHDRLYFMPDKGQTYITDSQLQPIADMPMPREECLFMIEDTKGGLWIGTKDGLYRRNMEGNLHRYGFANGLPSSIFTLCQPQTDHEGTIWLGNSKGLIYLKTDSVTDAAFPRPVAIVRHELKNNSLTVCFSDRKYSDPGATCFEYRLEGEEDEWQLLRNSSRVTYPNLGVGKYRFRVRVYGEPETETTLSVTVYPSRRMWVLLAVLVLGLLLIYPAYRVALFYYRKRHPLPESEQKEPRNKYANVSLSAETLDALHAQIDAVMAEQQLYLRSDLKIAEIAKMVNVPAYQLSYLFTQHMQTTFYDYVYHFRIEEFKRRVQAGDIKRYTVESLAEQCGFNSRASFFRNFKKEVGMTPNEYIKTLK